MDVTQLQEIEARLRDRERELAKVLNEDLQQRLYAIELQINFLREAARNGDIDQFEAEYDQLKSALKESIQVTHKLSADLSLSVLHDHDRPPDPGRR